MSRAYARWVTAIAALLFGLGLIWHALPATSALVRPLTPYMLLAFGLAALAPFVANYGRRAVAWMAGSYAAGFTLEAVGVATGLVFGPYEYSSALGARLLGVPPIIGFNWVVVTAGCAEAAAALIALAGPRTAPAAGAGFAAKPGGSDVAFREGAPIVRRRAKLAAAAIAAGLLAVGFDWIMEPAAVALGYWSWLAQAIPARNYLAWFAFAASSAAWLIASTSPEAEPREAGSVRGGKLANGPEPGFASAYVAVQTAFFVGIRLLESAGRLP